MLNYPVRAFGLVVVADDIAEMTDDGGAGIRRSFRNADGLPDRAAMLRIVLGEVLRLRGAERGAGQKQAGGEGGERSEPCSVRHGGLVNADLNGRSSVACPRPSSSDSRLSTPHRCRR